MKPNPCSSLNYFTRPLILEDIMTPVAHDEVVISTVPKYRLKESDICTSSWPTDC
ncbi:hypothetical protein ENKO_25600 [Enterobacter kobei]|uniref:Uncharacterized protein n=1 Tax=Enterobacter kobei TaxID=208224 RepID=A0AA86M555_9ENTR|nr:hypothetical protein ENKO_25600 [Enterobacter kobei]